MRIINDQGIKAFAFYDVGLAGSGSLTGAEMVERTNEGDSGGCSNDEINKIGVAFS